MRASKGDRFGGECGCRDELGGIRSFRGQNSVEFPHRLHRHRPALPPLALHERLRPVTMQYEVDSSIGTSSERLRHCIAMAAISLRHQILEAFPRERPQRIQSRLLIQHPRIGPGAKPRDPADNYQPHREVKTILSGHVRRHLGANIGLLRPGCDPATNVNQPGKHQAHPPWQEDKVLDS